ncbi:MAG: hypothetical protein HQ579_07970 [Candidatus Omnitrophica bacterium]|nr:hypothetical protein [Candidatus Omnitrophota bacterium]
MKIGIGKIILVLFIASGIMLAVYFDTSAKMIGAMNKEKINTLSVGMSIDKVRSIMMGETEDTEDSLADLVGDTVKKTMTTLTSIIASDISDEGDPYRTEIMHKLTSILVVDYYYTGDKKPDKDAEDSELTPLVFQDEKLIGVGWAFLKEKKGELPY